ncbi:unnamed protein product [Mycetohabitans rhizoxinica HKI 454]|uniref:Uncharacterized protein n=1 Tax=Mycetohabitans rhizoxinica (strain DSM 19002 / CIP 109453 / HKI 454) TaxID=882378 RepID=E5ASV6_MYCRK|nr:unnamed protein product [Mycetohabitans rhizoxinica HKI 454]
MPRVARRHLYHASHVAICGTRRVALAVSCGTACQGAGAWTGTVVRRQHRRGRRPR